MPRYLMLRTPSANRVYAGESGPLTAAELELTAPFARDIEGANLAGVDYPAGFALPAAPVEGEAFPWIAP